MNGYIIEFKEYLKSVKKTSYNTIDAYVRDITQFISFCESKNINNVLNIDRETVDSYISDLKRIGKSDATKTRVIASIRCYFKCLVFLGKIESNPADDIKNPRNAKKMPGVLDTKDILRLLEQPSGKDYKSIRDRAMLELLYATGIRVSELIGLTLNDINIQIGIITLHGEKSERIVPIYQKAINHLSEYINVARPAIICDQSQDRLFTNMSGKPMSRQGCWKIIKYYADKAGIEEDITPKTLRHSFATHLLENGAQLKDVKEMLGHSDISSTQVYAELIKSRYVRSYEKFHPLAGKK